MYIRTNYACAVVSGMYKCIAPHTLSGNRNNITLEKEPFRHSVALYQSKRLSVRPASAGYLGRNSMTTVKWVGSLCGFYICICLRNEIALYRSKSISVRHTSEGYFEGNSMNTVRCLYPLCCFYMCVFLRNEIVPL